MEVLGVFGDDWDGTVDERPGHRFRKTAVGERLGAHQLGAALYELPPGQASWPYHFHHLGEELLLVLRGRILVRTPSGERELGAGDIVLFPPGPDGAHAERNAGGEAARFLLVSTRPPLEVTEHPDTGKLNVYSPHATRRLRGGDEVDLWADESP